jgi:hypothetical protein
MLKSLANFISRLWLLPIGAYAIYAIACGVQILRGAPESVAALGVVSLPLSLLVALIHTHDVRLEFIAICIAGGVQYFLLGLLIRFVFEPF